MHLVRTRLGPVTAAAMATALLSGLALVPALDGRADVVGASEPSSGVVRDWNLHAVNALINGPSAPVPGAGQTPPVSQLHLAMVHGAVYDAVNSIDVGHEPYLAEVPPAPPTASQEAAVATAAHHVLVGIGLVPPLTQVVRDRLDGLYADALAAISDGAAKTDGIAAGEAAAAAMLAARANDGRYVPFSFTPGVEAGQWRPTPPGFVNDPFAWVGNVQTFVLESPSQFRSRGPQALTSAAYAREYNEVKELGGPDTPASPRTAEQTALARFYVVNPVELFNRTFRKLAADRALTLVEEARLFAMLNLAGADSLINCWNDKATWSFWRPITAIHEGDDDGNRRTVGDPGWTSFIAAPPYPDHTSGYNCVAGAMMYAAKAFFGRDRMDFSVVKIVPNVPDVTRDYERFTDVIDDTIDARVYEGIHFRAADVQGAEIGRRVARWLDRHYLQPVR